MQATTTPPDPAVLSGDPTVATPEEEARAHSLADECEKLECDWRRRYANTAIEDLITVKPEEDNSGLTVWIGDTSETFEIVDVAERWIANMLPAPPAEWWSKPTNLHMVYRWLRHEEYADDDALEYFLSKPWKYEAEFMAATFWNGRSRKVGG